MYGPWILVIIFTALILITLIADIFIVRAIKNDVRIEYEENCKLYPYTYANEARRHELYDYNLLDYAAFGITTVIQIALGLALFICLIIAITNPITAKNEYYKFEQDRIAITTVVENGTDMENIAISQTIIGYNTWLANAKANKKTYGSWSKYYHLDLDSLDYIYVGRDNNG